MGNPKKRIETKDRKSWLYVANISIDGVDTGLQFIGVDRKRGKMINNTIHLNKDHGLELDVVKILDKPMTRSECIKLRDDIRLPFIPQDVSIKEKALYLILKSIIPSSVSLNIVLTRHGFEDIIDREEMFNRPIPAIVKDTMKF